MSRLMKHLDIAGAFIAIILLISISAFGETCSLDQRFCNQDCAHLPSYPTFERESCIESCINENNAKQQAYYVCLEQQAEEQEAKEKTQNGPASEPETEESIFEKDIEFAEEEGVECVGGNIIVSVENFKPRIYSYSVSENLDCEKAKERIIQLAKRPLDLSRNPLAKTITLKNIGGEEYDYDGEVCNIFGSSVSGKECTPVRKEKDAYLGPQEATINSPHRIFYARYDPAKGEFAIISADDKTGVATQQDIFQEGEYIAVKREKRYSFTQQVHDQITVAAQDYVKKTGDQPDKRGNALQKALYNGVTGWPLTQEEIVELEKTGIRLLKKE